MRDEAAVAALAVPDMDKLRYVFDAVASIRRALDGRVPLIGFSGSPWTLACYMVEGAGSDDYRLVKTMLYARPDLMHRMLAINADAVAQYLNAQIAAGAQAVMIFDSWGGVLADGAFQQFSLAYTDRVLRQLTPEHDGAAHPAHRLHQGRRLAGSSRWRSCGPDVLGVDWTVNLGEARRRVGDRVALQGNLDPERAVRPAARRSRPRWLALLEVSARTRCRRRRRPHLQPRARHQPAYPARERRRAGRGGAPAFAPAARRQSEAPPASDPEDASIGFSRVPCKAAPVLAERPVGSLSSGKSVLAAGTWL